jgi:hypothetical protein
MPKAPNHQKLVVTNKQLPLSSGNYRDDMRTIEQWANEGIVRKLIAGSNITLTPSNGVDQGQGIEIAASGGGGGALPAYGGLTCGMDSSQYPFAQWIGPTDPSFTNACQIGPLQQDEPTAVHYTFATSWITAVGIAGLSVLTLPEFSLPAFSNAGSNPILFTFYIGAWDFDTSFTNYAQYEGTVSIPVAGGSVQCTVGDLTAIEAASGDLSLVAGSGQSGNGLVSAGAGLSYIASISGAADVPAGTTFP